MKRTEYKLGKDTTLALTFSHNNEQGDTIEIALDGRLDVKAAKDAESEFDKAAGNYTNIVLDLENLSYIASAGLRTLKRLSKTMKQNDGSLVLKNVNDDIMEIFDITGFAALLTFE